MLVDRGIPLSVVLPRIVHDGEMEGLKQELRLARSVGIREALVGNLGLLIPVKECGFRIRGDFGLNIFNSRAMEVCRRLERVVIGTYVQMICAGAFSGCERLSELVFNGPFPLICKGAFRDCKALADGDGFIILNGTLCGYTGNQTDVTIPEGVLSVSGAFGGYAELTSVKIPDTVKRIEADAFSGCKKLKELTVPAGVEYFDEAAVADCTRLKKLRFLSTQTQMGLDPIWQNKYLWARISCKIIAPSGSMVEGYVKKRYPLQLITE
jgi:hypothetical protein